MNIPNQLAINENDLTEVNFMSWIPADHYQIHLQAFHNLSSCFDQIIIQHLRDKLKKNGSYDTSPSWSRLPSIN